MKRQNSPRTIRNATGAAGLAVLLAISGYVAPAAAATTTAWAGWDPLTGETGNYTTSLTFGSAPGLTAGVTSTSRSGQVGVISGASTWLSEGTPVGAKYGSSRNEPYLNMRQFNDYRLIPSVTTYKFVSPTP
ncbi:MAG: cell wall anchor protein, partial [Glaciihabitans sp.]|nr:cell wall anchor protein [Glaciihabitans sp.]